MFLSEVRTEFGKITLQSEFTQRELFWKWLSGIVLSSAKQPLNSLILSFLSIIFSSKVCLSSSGNFEEF